MDLASERTAAMIREIRDAADLPRSFPPGVEAAAQAALTAPGLLDARIDLTGIDFVTLDPASSTDLDQAFALHEDGDTIVLSYAMADIAAFAPEGDPVTDEAWNRGVTVYLPDGRVPLYPPVLSEGGASLLPDGPRPAIVLEVGVAPDATPTLRSARRAVIRSRAKLAYETTEPADLGPLATELHRRMTESERRRGAFKIDWPEQAVVLDPSDPNGARLELRPLRRVEEVNASFSLATNFAVARLCNERHLGLFRVMPEPDADRRKTLRRSARALGVDWPADEPLRTLLARLDISRPADRALLIEARRAARGASYALYDERRPAWHAALAAPYAHATAPMRRLGDRYVLELVLALLAGRSINAIEAALTQLPHVMGRAETRAATLERQVIDLVEALELEGRIGEDFDAEVIDITPDGALIQLSDPPVRARVPIGSATLDDGGRVRVRLERADPSTRAVRFVLTG